MKLFLTTTLHYVLFGLSLLLFPARINQTMERLQELKTEKTTRAPQETEKPAEILHSEILFRY